MGQFAFLGIHEIDSVVVSHRLDRRDAPSERGTLIGGRSLQVYRHRPLEQLRALDWTRLLYLSSQTMVRHTKDQQVNGKRLVEMAPKREELMPVTLGETEKATYIKLHEMVRCRRRRRPPPRRHVAC